MRLAERRERAGLLRLGERGRRIAPDLLTLASLTLALYVLLGYLAMTPAASLNISPGREETSVALRDFYGVERAATGPFRWSKPEASLVVPVAAPATYRISLTLQDTPLAPPRRPVTILVQGRPAAAATLDTAARATTFDYEVTPRDWALAPRRTLDITLRTTPFVPPDDPRPLGVNLSRVVVRPLPLPWPRWFALVGAASLLLGAAYAALRLTARRRALAVAAPALALLGGACLAAADRPAALLLACRLTTQPAIVLGLLLGLTLLPGGRAALADVASPSPAGEPGDGAGRRFWARQSLPLLPVLALALELRLYHLDKLSLWIDEGATITSARLPWPRVLGLGGFYEDHPPLYFTLVKAVSLVVPEVRAGRVLSAVLGTLTVAVVYALALRLLGRPAALCASLVLALSPFHIWYSQEGRMYATCALLVGLSYLALVAAAQADGRGAERRRWAATYGGAVLLAMYVDYSAVYALAPQVALLALVAKRQGRRAIPLLAATLAAAVAYLPWLPQLFADIQQVGSSRTPFIPTPTSVSNSLLALAGIGGTFRSYRLAAPQPTPWDTWPAWRWALLLAFAPALLGGLAVVARRSAVAALAVGGLLVGTVVSAIMMSAISPGYADRTILPTVLGWALLLGAGLAVRRPVLARAAGYASLAAVLIVSGVALGLSERGAAKQDFRALAADAATIPGIPIALVDPITEALIEVYQPAGSRARFVHVRTVSPRSWPPESWYALTPPLPDVAGRVDALWFEYNAYGGGDDVRHIQGQLRALGFACIRHRDYGYPALEFYARPGTPLAGRAAGSPCAP